MCSNYVPVTTRERLMTFFGVDRDREEAPADVFPLGLAPFIRLDPERKDALIVEDGIFGLLPHFAAEVAYGRRTYNARSETVHKLNSFRRPWAASQRCVIPAEAIYEPNWETGKAVRWRISLPGEVPMGVAGIYETWRHPDGRVMASFSMLTVNADDHPLMKRFHKPADEKRMVVILRPEEFLAAMLNSQPLGFYSPSQLVQDARRHEVVVRGVDVMCSDHDCTMEEASGSAAVRLGLRRVSGLKETSALRIMAARAEAPFDSADDLARWAGLDQPEMRLLAGADALMSLSGHRRQQVWDASGLRAAPELLREAPVHEQSLELPAAPEGEEIVLDYQTTGLTLRRHPLALLRPLLDKRRLATAEQLQDYPDGRLVRYCGIVTLRQQPDTAGGVIFVSLEDETGVVQVIVWKRVRELQRKALLGSRLLAVYGTWQREGEVRNLIAGRLEDLTPLLGEADDGESGFSLGGSASVGRPLATLKGHLLS